MMNYPSYSSHEFTTNPFEEPDTNQMPAELDASGILSEAVMVGAESRYRVAEAMRIANEIPGVEYESFQDWLDHVDKIVERIKRG